MQAQESCFPSMNVVTSISEVIMEYLIFNMFPEMPIVPNVHNCSQVHLTLVSV